MIYIWEQVISTQRQEIILNKCEEFYRLSWKKFFSKLSLLKIFKQFCLILSSWSTLIYFFHSIDIIFPGMHHFHCRRFFKLSNQSSKQEVGQWLQMTSWFQCVCCLQIKTLVNQHQRGNTFSASFLYTRHCFFTTWGENFSFPILKGGSGSIL